MLFLLLFIFFFFFFLFPTFQMRAVRFYMSSSPSPPCSSSCSSSSSSWLVLAFAFSVRCRTSTAISHAQCSLPGLNRDQQCPVWLPDFNHVKKSVRKNARTQKCHKACRVRSMGRNGKLCSRSCLEKRVKLPHENT